jgi:hypothetical protein
MTKVYVYSVPVARRGLSDGPYWIYQPQLSFKHPDVIDTKAEFGRQGVLCEGEIELDALTVDRIEE